VNWIASAQADDPREALVPAQPGANPYLSRRSRSAQIRDRPGSRSRLPRGCVASSRLVG
jgi:hypothetical protein